MTVARLIQLLRQFNGDKSVYIKIKKDEHTYKIIKISDVKIENGQIMLCSI